MRIVREGPQKTAARLSCSHLIRILWVSEEERRKSKALANKGFRLKI